MPENAVYLGIEDRKCWYRINDRNVGIWTEDTGNNLKKGCYRIVAKQDEHPDDTWFVQYGIEAEGGLSALATALQHANERTKEVN